MYKKNIHKNTTCQLFRKKLQTSMHAKLEFITIKSNFEGKCQLTIEDKYFRCTICLVFGSVK